MRILQRMRDVQNMALQKDGDYTVSYEYDANNRITKEVVTGDIQRITTFEYDAHDNISKEIYDDGIKIITKVYSYDLVTGNIVNIQVTSVDK